MLIRTVCLERHFLWERAVLQGRIQRSHLTRFERLVSLAEVTDNRNWIHGSLYSDKGDGVEQSGKIR